MIIVSPNRIKVLVYGWYNKCNLGDELFKVAFCKLFPNFDFTFTDIIKKELLNQFDNVFFGGGSFLDGKPEIYDDCIEILKTKNIFYIGVGAETGLHPIHAELLKIAKLIAIRSSVNLDNILEINKNAIVIPDIVYYLSENNYNKSNDKNVLFVPNALVIPDYSSEHWKHVFWNKFKLEIGQFFDYLISDGYKIGVFSMSNNVKFMDSHAAIEIINCMKNKNIKIHNEDYKNVFPKYDFIISQRYHGTILADIFNIPHMTIYHHDKLKESYLSNGTIVSFYECTKDLFKRNFISIKNKSFDISIFSNLIGKVNGSICRN